MEIQKIVVTKSYAFPHILGCSSSYMTLQPLLSEFLIPEENLIFFFISVLWLWEDNISDISTKQ